MSRKTKKLDAYSKDGKAKYTEEDFDDSRKKKRKVREQVRNANRYLKKAKRQELKKDLDNLINEE
jgi:hypothetical protein